MTRQLRTYRVKPGAMDAWVREWTEEIRPLREQAGFTVLGPWVNPTFFMTRREAALMVIVVAKMRWAPSSEKPLSTRACEPSVA